MIEQQRVYRIKDLGSLLGFLREDLCWDFPEASIDDVSFEWTGLDLNLSEDINKKLKDGLIRQLQPFATHQPWGIFVVEFATHEVSIITLRQILRCFVAKRRGARPDLPAWQCENLLFICLYGENGFTFAHFKGDKPYSSKLTTFSWHPGEPIRTVCEFNLPALVYDYTWTPDTWVEEWQKAFDVEKVNKDFYRQIAHFYYRLTGKEGQKRELVLPYVGDDSGSISIYEEFAVRLIGRSIFCWFLKHKESANDVPLIPPEALSLAAARETADFYHSMLEPLFFEVMNKRIKERKSLSIPRSEIIPFLNGGLFEQHPNDFYADAPNYGLKIPDTWFVDFFSLLERYNFTITENSSIDVDVAVDPEMLGRIFENLLAEVVPETGETARKATGSYYTPRVIVDYMVEQSLKQYLLTKTKLGEEKVNRLLEYGEDIEDFLAEEKLAALTALREIKVIDPACGSGAFLMGILHRMLAVLEKVDPRLELWRAQYLKSLDGIVRQTVEKNISRENWAYIRKLMIIRDSIYGVDIQPIAVEIAKLRCFLSLVVDEIVLDDEENRGIEPLPNLEFKFVAANTLIDLPEITDMGIMENRELIDELATLRKEYFGDSGENKEKIKHEFKAVQAKLGEHYKKLLITKKTDFTGATRKLETKEATQTQLLAEWDPFSYESCGWFDPDWMFGVNDGFDIVIANPPWVFTRLGDFEEAFKKLITDKYLKGLSGSQQGRAKQSGKINTFAIFILQGLRLLKPNGALTYIIPNTLLRATVYDAIRKFLLDNCRIMLIVDLSSGRFDNVTAATAVICLKNIRSDEIHEVKIVEDFDLRGEIKFNRIAQADFFKNVSFTFSIFATDEVNRLVKKIESSGERLDRYFIVFAGGIATGPGKHDYIESKPLSSKYKPLIEGKDVKKYRVVFGNKYILYDRKKLYRAREESIFLCPKKLITQRIGGSCTPLVVAYDDKQFYTFNSTNCILPKTGSDIELKYLLAILNSRLLNWYYYIRFTNKSTLTVNISKTFLEQLPIKKTDKKGQESIVALVDQILSLVEDRNYFADSSKQTRVWELESKIDDMVFELYNLTPEETDIVKNNN